MHKPKQPRYIADPADADQIDWSKLIRAGVIAAVFSLSFTLGWAGASVADKPEPAVTILVEAVETAAHSDVVLSRRAPAYVETGEAVTAVIKPTRSWTYTTEAEPEEIVTNTDAYELKATEPAPASTVRYALTDAERDVIERVVMAESGAENRLGQMAVAWCILNACELEDIRPDEIVIAYRYTSWRPEPTAAVKEAVAAVFDRGEQVVDGVILYFYNPAMCRSTWHEEQTYVLTIQNHRFFR